MQEHHGNLKLDWIEQKSPCKWCKTTCLSWWQYSSLEEDWKKSRCSMNHAHYLRTTCRKYFLAEMCKGHLQKKKKYSTVLPSLQTSLFQTERFSYHKNYTNINMHSPFTTRNSTNKLLNERFVTRFKSSTQWTKVQHRASSFQVQRLMQSANAADAFQSSLNTIVAAAIPSSRTGCFCKNAAKNSRPVSQTAWLGVLLPWKCATATNAAHW